MCLSKVEGSSSCKAPLLMFFGPRAPRMRLTHRYRSGNGCRQYGVMNNFSSTNNAAMRGDVAPLDSWPRCSIVLKTCVRMNSGWTASASHSSLSVTWQIDKFLCRIADLRNHENADDSRSRKTLVASLPETARYGKTWAPWFSSFRVRSADASPCVTLNERRLRPWLLVLLALHRTSCNRMVASSNPSV